MLILLSPQKRHVVMYPLEEAHKVEVLSEQWEDTIQLLIGKKLEIFNIGMPQSTKILW